MALDNKLKSNCSLTLVEPAAESSNQVCRYSTHVETQPVCCAIAEQKYWTEFAINALLTTEKSMIIRIVHIAKAGVR